MNKYSLSALAAAGLLAGGLATSANAADLGGNCCADLEERVAELEATTARKGNRKVSLTISGWVAEQVTWWDDGGESNVYVSGLGTTLGTNVKFTGQATIVPGWTAGYVIHIEADGSDSLTTSQAVDNGPGLYTGKGNYVQLLQSFWFIKSDTYGKVSVGMQSQASDNTAILVDGSGSLVVANWVDFNSNSFFVRFAGGGLSPITWGAAGGCVWGDCNGVPTNSVRYDTPTFAGFSASASWGEDDFWDIALRYAGEMHGFKLAAAAAYSESTDATFPPAQADNTQYFQIGAYVQHIATGLFLYGAYGNLESDVAGIPSSDTWYIKPGIRAKWNHLGATILYGEYLHNDDGGFGNLGATSTELDVWGLGAVQEVDAAAMSTWIRYRHNEYDDNVAGTAFDDFDEFSFGALINF
jgi:hypothetical protein